MAEIDIKPSSAELVGQQQQQQQQQHQQQHHNQNQNQIQNQGQNQSNSPAQSSTPPGGTFGGPSSSLTAAQNAQAQLSFRRHQVRCDAASLGVPCTNCVAFQIECKIPQPKRKKTQANAAKDSDSERGDAGDSQSPQPMAGPMAGSSTTFSSRPPAVYHTSEGVPTTTLTEAQARKEEVDNDTYVNLVMKPKFTRAPITEAGRVAFLGESSNLTLLVHDRQGDSDVVHYPLPENVRGSRARLTELDNIEIDILHQRGAFLLPPRQLCDELIEAYFKWCTLLYRSSTGHAS
ncbi:hypothetical protein E0Z10_g8361 [Xylaria hypoxylon]|uniref:Zn(2)-C6 fungal-type domain-containing protein n=1 Tax=Xylaria hypoxylon TaxID=37992 RepID=A0A4Z0Y8A8_9PEZI|nr:hypothetical protein E0Z10_g8361 [Xylaria hypoxylon]